MKKFLWIAGLIVAILTAVITYCSCTVTTEFTHDKNTSPTIVSPVKVSSGGISATSDSIRVDSFNVK